MRKEDLIKLGLDEAMAQKVADASAEELKGFIPKSRFDDVNEAKKAAETALTERDKQLSDLKKSVKDQEELVKQIETLQETNKTSKADYEAKIKQMQIESAVKEELAASGIVGDVKIKMVKALLDLSNPEMDGEKVKGLSDQLKKLREAEETKGLFGSEKQRKGMSPDDSGDQKPTGITKEQFARMGYSERLNLFNTNKELYDQLSQN